MQIYLPFHLKFFSFIAFEVMYLLNLSHQDHPKNYCNNIVKKIKMVVSKHLTHLLTHCEQAP